MSSSRGITVASPFVPAVAAPHEGRMEAARAARNRAAEKARVYPATRTGMRDELACSSARERLELEAVLRSSSRGMRQQQQQHQHQRRPGGKLGAQAHSKCRPGGSGRGHHPDPHSERCRDVEAGGGSNCTDAINEAEADHVAGGLSRRVAAAPFVLAPDRSNPRDRSAEDAASRVIGRPAPAQASLAGFQPSLSPEPTAPHDARHVAAQTDAAPLPMPRGPAPLQQVPAKIHTRQRASTESITTSVAATAALTSPTTVDTPLVCRATPRHNSREYWTTAADNEARELAILEAHAHFIRARFAEREAIVLRRQREEEEQQRIDTCARAVSAADRDGGGGGGALQIFVPPRVLHVRGARVLRLEAFPLHGHSNPYLQQPHLLREAASNTAADGSTTTATIADASGAAAEDRAALTQPSTSPNVSPPPSPEKATRPPQRGPQQLARAKSAVATAPPAGARVPLRAASDRQLGRATFAAPRSRLSAPLSPPPSPPPPAASEQISITDVARSPQLRLGVDRDSSDCLGAVRSHVPSHERSLSSSSGGGGVASLALSPRRNAAESEVVTGASPPNPTGSGVSSSHSFSCSGSDAQQEEETRCENNARAAVAADIGSDSRSGLPTTSASPEEDGDGGQNAAAAASPAAEPDAYDDGEEVELLDDDDDYNESDHHEVADIVRPGAIAQTGDAQASPAGRGGNIAGPLLGVLENVEEEEEDEEDDDDHFIVVSHASSEALTAAISEEDEEEKKLKKLCGDDALHPAAPAAAGKGDHAGLAQAAEADQRPLVQDSSGCAPPPEDQRSRGSLAQEDARREVDSNAAVGDNDWDEEDEDDDQFQDAQPQPQPQPRPALLSAVRLALPPLSPKHRAASSAPVLSELPGEAAARAPPSPAAVTTSHTPRSGGSGASSPTSLEALLRTDTAHLVCGLGASPAEPARGSKKNQQRGAEPAGESELQRLFRTPTVLLGPTDCPSARAAAAEGVETVAPPMESGRFSPSFGPRVESMRLVTSPVSPRPGGARERRVSFDEGASLTIRCRSGQQDDEKPAAPTPSPLTAAAAAAAVGKGGEARAQSPSPTATRRYSKRNVNPHLRQLAVHELTFLEPDASFRHPGAATRRSGSGTFSRAASCVVNGDEEITELDLAEVYIPPELEDFYESLPTEQERSVFKRTLSRLVSVRGGSRADAARWESAPQPAAPPPPPQRSDRIITTPPNATSMFEDTLKSPLPLDRTLRR